MIPAVVVKRPQFLAGLVAIAITLAFLFSAMGPPLGISSLHPADAHSSLLHSSSTVVLSSDRAFSPEVVTRLPKVEPSTWGSTRSLLQPGRIDTDPPDHPPR